MSTIIVKKKAYIRQDKALDTSSYAKLLIAGTAIAIALDSECKAESYTFEKNIKQTRTTHYPHFSMPYQNNRLIQKERQKAKIKSFGILDANWDGYGASQVLNRTVVEACEYVDHLFNKGLDSYFVTPTANGDILIELKNGEKAIEIELLAEGKMEYATFESNEMVQENAFTVNSSKEKDFLNWLQK